MAAFLMTLLALLVPASALAQASFDIEKERELLQTIIESRVSRVQGVEILVTGGTDVALESAFGHSAIRLVENPDLPLNDLVISFEAMTADASRPAILVGGAVGSFPIVPTVRRMVDYIRVNAETGNRDFSRIPIQLTHDELHRLVLAITAFPRQAKYSFANRNCAWGILKLFRMARIDLPVTTRVPSSLLAVFEWAGRVVKKPLNVAGASATLNRAAKRIQRAPLSQSKQVELVLKRLDFLSYADLLTLYFSKGLLSRHQLLLIQNHLKDVRRLPVNISRRVSAFDRHAYQR